MAISLSSASSTTTARFATNAPPETLGSLASQTLTFYLDSPEHHHLIVTEKDYSALIAFLRGDLDSLYHVESLLLASIHTKAYLRGGEIFVGKARVIPSNHLAQVLVTMPYRHRVASMVADASDNFFGVPESLVVAWHLQLSHQYPNMEHDNLSPSPKHATAPSMSSTCLPLLSELPSITVAQFLSCINNRSLLISLEQYDTTLEALASDPHASLPPNFRCWNEGVSLRDGRLFVGTRTIVTIEKLPAILKLFPPTASEARMVQIAQRNYCGVPESLVREWYRRLSQHHQKELVGRVIRKREDGREDALSGSGPSNLRELSSMHGEGTRRKRAREEEGECEDEPERKRRRLGDILRWMWRTISRLQSRLRR